MLTLPSVITPLKETQALPSLFLSHSEHIQQHTAHCINFLLPLPIIQKLTITRSLPSHAELIRGPNSSFLVAPFTLPPVNESMNTELLTFLSLIISRTRSVSYVYLLPAWFFTVSVSRNVFSLYHAHHFFFTHLTFSFFETL